MHLRQDTSTAPNGIFMRAGNASTNYTLYLTGGDENNRHLVVRGDGVSLFGTGSARTNFKMGSSGNGQTPKFQFETANDDSNNSLSSLPEV